MKNTLITLLLILLCRQGDAQYKALQIGDKVPDFEFQIKNYKTPTAKISDFKGKLVFFDFWSTYCSSCIAGFPKMEKLQKEFGDKIIVILVNIRETKKEVNARLNVRKKIAPELSRMPSIIDEQAFAQLFPHPLAGNYIWIDPEGVLRLNTSVAYNIHPKKIREVLDGKEISFLTSGKVYGLTDKEPTLLNIVNDTNSSISDTYNIVSPVNLDYYPMGGLQLNQIDTLNNTIRNTYINRGVAELYYFALQESLKEEWKSKVVGPKSGGFKYLDQFHFLVRDSSLYDNWLIIRDLQTDENMTRSLYCYEQVLPLNTPPHVARSYMREDLDRYFGLRYGSKVSVEPVEIPCYILRVVANYKALSDKELKSRLKHLNKKEFDTHRSYGDALSMYFRAAGNYPYVFTEESIRKNINVFMPVWKKGDQFEDFLFALRLNGLELIAGRKNINMIVIKD